MNLRDHRQKIDDEGVPSNASWATCGVFGVHASTYVKSPQPRLAQRSRSPSRGLPNPHAGGSRDGTSHATALDGTSHATALAKNTDAGGSHMGLSHEKAPAPRSDAGASQQLRAGAGPARSYLRETAAPAASSFSLAASASSFLAPSRTALGADSTRVLASLRPREVSSRTTLMT